MQQRAASSLSWGAAIIGHLIRPEETCRERARVATVISPKHLSQGALDTKLPCSLQIVQKVSENLLQQHAAAPSPAYLCIYLWLFSSDLFVQVSVFVRFIGFPKTGYLDITGVCHDIQNFTNNPILFFNTLFILGQTLVRLQLIKN